MTGLVRSLSAVLGLLGVAALLTGHARAGEPPVAPLTPPMPPGGTSGPPPQAVPQPSSSGPGQPPAFNAPNPPGQQRFTFKILPNTPTKTLLPIPPTVKPVAGPVLTDDLSKIPEAEFAASPEKASDPKLTEHAAHQLAKIAHMNAKKTDAFMRALVENRDDLAGLPFAMGDDCRTTGEMTRQFAIAANTVRQALGGGAFQTEGRSSTIPLNISGQGVGFPQFAGFGGGTFWSQYFTLCEQQDAARAKPSKLLQEHVMLARMAALTQMLAPESAEMRLGLVKYLAGVPHPESSKALARMAIYSPEDEVRSAAIDALKIRKEKDYTDVLVKGLRYPWPAVAGRAADAIAKLGRADLVSELIAVLDEADPRLPATKGTGEKKISVVREMVKINHHRNCMMCHAPGNPETGSGNALVAEVAVPGQPLPSPSEGYRQSSPDLMIRIDVTYLRQDFSAMLPVRDAHPWPENQRFDFLVRERKLTDEEAGAYRDQLTPKVPGVLSPYHKAALAALRDITGKDTAPTAEAWRKLLKIDAKPRD